MQRNEGRCALLRMQLVALVHGQANTIGLKPFQLLARIRHVGTSWIAKGVPASSVALGEYVSERHPVGIGEAAFASDARMGPLRKRLCHLNG